MPRVTPIVLAAGMSRRMGRTKALLDLGGVPCIARVLSACMDGGAGTPLVVLGHDRAAVEAALPEGTTTIMNSEFASTGPAASLRLALPALPVDADAFLLFPVDFPLVGAGDVAALLERWEAVRDGRRIVVPSHDMRRGHPALYARSLVPAFEKLRDDEPLHRVLRDHDDEVEHVLTDNPGVLLNMDTPEDYRRCRRMLRDRP